MKHNKLQNDVAIGRGKKHLAIYGTLVAYNNNVMEYISNNDV